MINKSYLIGLVFSCPYTEGNPEECKLHEIRKKAKAQQIEWFNSLSEEELQKIYDVHQNCPIKKRT